MSGGAPGQFSSVLIEHVLRTGRLREHIHELLIPTYQVRSEVMRKAVNQVLSPLGVRIITESKDKEAGSIFGGFFLFILLPVGLKADDVAAIALEEYNLQILSGLNMTVNRSKSPPPFVERGMRLCWAWEEEEQIRDGIDRLKTVLTSRFGISYTEI